MMQLMLMSSEATSEDGLVRAAAEGDRGAFGELYVRYARMVHGILLARVRPAEAEDLVQEVFLSAMKQLARAAYGGGVSRVAGHHRAQSRDGSSPPRPRNYPVELLDPPAPRGAAQDAFLVLDQIRRLPEAYRETLVLRLVQGMTGPEIAAQTGLTHESVRVNLCRRDENAARIAGDEMNDDYLWDRSGPPDLEVARLEQRLAPLRYRHRRLPGPSRMPWAVAAAVVAAAAGLVLMVTPPAQGTAWQLAGASLRQGQTVRTGGSAVRLEAEEVGRVDLAPNSVLRAAGGKRLTLQRGELRLYLGARARIRRRYAVGARRQPGLRVYPQCR